MKKHSNKTAFYLLSFVLMLLAFSCRHKSQSDAMNLNIGIQNSPSNSLIMIASKKNFFDTSKVKVTIQNFTAGKLALQALLGNKGDIDVSVCAETPVVLSTLGGNQIRVISQIVDAKNECRVVVLKDKNKNNPESYFSEKRKIATSFGGSPEWLTYNFFKMYNIDSKNVEIISMQPQDMPVALSKKVVSGISIFDPFARIAERDSTIETQTFLNTDISSYYVLSVTNKTFEEKEDALVAFLKGLARAAEFIKTNPEEAKQIIADHTKLDINIINETWKNYSFNLGLSKELIALCNSEAEWAITTNKYPANTPIPNFKNVLSDELLSSVPGSLIEVK